MKTPVEIFITGDFYSGHRIEELIKKKEYDHIFNDFLPVIRNADIAITNLEAPLIRNGKPIEKTGPAIKAIPETIEAIKYAGFNILTLANNHIMDYGAEGLMNTMNLCLEHGIEAVGAGTDYQNASQTLYKHINDLRIAFINFAENEWSTTEGDAAGAHPLNPIANFYTIHEAKKNADFVIVILHGGHETYELPSPRMKQTYRFFADAGASAVIGHHTHCSSGFEIYKDTPIFYSLGNFIFDSSTAKPENWYYGFGVKLKLIENNKISFEIFPYEQCKSTAGIQKLTEEAKTIFFSDLEKLNTTISDDRLLREYFKNFIDSRLSKTYNAFLEPHSIKPLRILQNLKLVPSIISKNKRKLYLNLIRCEAHRDVVLELLKDDCNS